MNQNIFINEAINAGILNYLNNTNNDDFITIIIKTLISIYGELDIINPYKTNTESGLGSFDENITKFGYSLEELSLFKQNIMNFYLTKNETPNKYFNKIEKQLIDMYFCKLKSMNMKTEDSFKSLIQFEDSNLNSLFSTDKEEIKRYFDYKNKFLNSNINYKVIENNTLNKDAYEIVGYSYDNIIQMNQEQLKEIDNKVFEYFKIDQTKEDKYIRLEQAVEYHKYFYTKENKTENGYAEFLLLSTFVSISILVVLVVVGVLSR